MAPSRGPGPVAAVHRITIFTALLGALAFAFWEVHDYSVTRAPSAALAAVLAFLVASGIGVYLRSLRGLGAKLSPRAER